jgi:hexosaminidase
MSHLEKHPEVLEAGSLQAYFGKRILEMLGERNLTMGGWEEIALLRDTTGRWIPNQEFFGTDILAYVWNSLDSYLDLGNRMANAGFPVVLCNVDNFYFDLAYTHHPAEPGHYWGGFVDTRRAYAISPFSLFNSVLTDRFRRPMEEQDFSNFETLTTQARRNIQGLQAELWSETLRDSEMLEYYYLPKLLGFAHRAWEGEPDWSSIEDREERVKLLKEDWNRVASAIGKRELPRLERISGGYHFRVPPPGAQVREGTLHANVAFPGLEIRYTVDGSDPDLEAMLYSGPVPVEGTVKLAAFTPGGRKSRISLATGE